MDSCTLALDGWYCTLPKDHSGPCAARQNGLTLAEQAANLEKYGRVYPKQPTEDQLSSRFSYHPPKGDQRVRYDRIRFLIGDVAKECVSMTPCSPEQTRALNALDEAMMLFNAAIARNE